MAQQFITDDGVVLIIPGAYPSIKVQAGASGLSTTGVLALVGEADAGPDVTLETDLTANIFATDSLADVVAKYKSGPLVDAFRGACAAANDPDIVGSPNGIILVKTNPSTKATSNLLNLASAVYAPLQDKSYGKLGNLIYWTVAQATPETKPTTGAFTWIPPVGTVALSIRVNGGSEVTHTTIADETPAVFQAALNALTGVSCTGGAALATAQSSVGTLAVAATGATATITYSGTFTNTPAVGDTVVIPSTSVIVGAGNANAGAYVVTGATSNTITAVKLSDAGKPGAVIGTVTNPVVVSAASVSGTVANDIVDYGSIIITQSSNSIIDGVGKTLAICQLTSGTDLLSRTAFVLGTTTPVSWVSKSGAPQVLVSASEYSVTLNVNRQVDNVSEAWTAGGTIALKLGYTGTSCSVSVSATQLSTSPVGGSGASFTVNLKDFPTLNDLAAYINAQTGYSCSVGSNAVGQVLSTALDEGTFTAGSTFGSQTCRIKMDAVLFYQAVSQSALVQLNLAVGEESPLAGLPATQSTPTFLAGGARGATTDAVYDAAIDAIQAVKCNFVVPLFSRDATADIADGLTDSGSSYTIVNVNAYAKSHVLAMSTIKKRRNRQAFCSQRDTFLNVQSEASGLASYRVSLAFQDIKDVGANGIVQFQPWMGAVKAAAMQAAAFYKAIVNKGINCSGVLQAAGDFKDSKDSDLETALNAGLLPAKKSDDGGFKWVSDQTTYLKDNNFVFNSIQAVYAADTIALTTAQRMEKAFVGQSVADVSAAVALSALEGIMADFLRLKLIAVSDDAPKGFKNAKIKITGTTMQVSVEIKLAGAIYFIPISFLVSQVTQSAAA